jgi:hypothetical protein
MNIRTAAAAMTAVAIQPRTTIIRWGRRPPISALDFATVEQLTAHAAADVKGGEAPRLGAELFDERDDRKVVGQSTPRLDPTALAPGLVGRIGFFETMPSSPSLHAASMT